ncbi:hypothetical protein ACFOJE_17970 [Azotobacter bryophylli]|uniref:Uncharacterized protein n=1 Tax=Azotobacter bryophylli TaxID=1986537 RepID=A0ABV7AXJ1_9GAMM
MLQANDQLIGTVSPQIVESASLLNSPHEGRTAEYEIAAWLRLPGLIDLPVSLLVSYRDGERLRETTVDHGKVDGSGRVLLSGVARLPVQQRIGEMQVCLRSAITPQAMQVENLFVQAAEQSHRVSA